MNFMPEQYRANKWTAIERGAKTFEGDSSEEFVGKLRFGQFAK